MEYPMRLQMSGNVSVSAVAIMVVVMPGLMILGLTGCSSSGPSSTQSDTAEKPATAPTAKAAKAAVPAPPAWRINAMDGAKATLAVSPDNGMKVDIGQLGDGKDWQIQLVRPDVSVKAKTRYSVTFLARAVEPRTVVVKTLQNNKPWGSVGLSKEVNLTEQWQGYRLDFNALADEEKTRLCFSLGSNAAAVEIRDVDFAPQAWFLGVSKDAKATLETPAGLPAAARVTIAKAADAERPWAVRLNGPPFPVSDGEELYASFRARADKPRQIIATVNMANPPGTSIGLRRPVELSSEWKSYGFAFKPTVSEPAAQLAFLLGENDAAVEVQSASVRKAAWKLTAGKDYEAVLTFLDRVPDGMRVDIGRLLASEPWRVQLRSQPAGLKANAKYQFSFRIRADKPRKITFGVKESQEPWAGLGLQGVVQVMEKWQSISREFTAKADTSNAVWAFDLGGSDVPVELADVSFQPAKPKPAAAN